jgi:rod shape-determining protein MreB
MVVSKSLDVAGDELDEAIIQYFRRKYNLLVGETTAEDVKIKIGSVFPLPEEQVMEVKGRDQVTGLPKTVTITSEEVRQALADPIKLIIEVIKQTLEETPAELAADLVDTGIVLAGGGALLRVEELDQMRRDRRALPLN